MIARSRARKGRNAAKTGNLEEREGEGGREAARTGVRYDEG